MARQQPFVNRLRACLLALGVVVATPAALAQRNRLEVDVDTPGLTIEAAAGWDGTVDRSTPIPVSLLIKNDSDRPIQGQLILSNDLTGRGATLGEIFVAPGTTRRFASIRAMTDWYECFVTLRDGQNVLWRRELPLITGSEFDPGVNFTLFIDRYRKLYLPGSATNAAVNPATNIATTTTTQSGKPVRCLSVKPWQVPDHPGPLLAVQAMVFPEGAAETDLNQAQWRAIAAWMCRGGTVFAHTASREIIDRLTRDSPLDAGEFVPSEIFAVRRVGLGTIYAYSEPLFASQAEETKRLIGEVIANLHQPDASKIVVWGYNFNRGGQAELNRVLVVGFFVVYALVSGVGTMLLFRSSQRRVATYTVIVVVGASALAGLLGGFLRLSNGDLCWTTVTQPGAGGAVQSGRVEVQSAGGRSKRVAIGGRHPDLQLLAGSPRWYSYPWDRRRSDYSAFTWQPNLAKSVDGVYRINVPITPWGSRQLTAVDFRRDLGRMAFELAFERDELQPGDEDQQQTSLPMPRGVFSVKLVNGLPFDVEDCRLVIGLTRASAAAVANQFRIYQAQPLPRLRSGATLENSFPANFRPLTNDWDVVHSWQGGWIAVPEIPLSGTAAAWIIGRIEQSPVMTIDRQRCDFVPRDEFHLFVQQILPEDFPDASVLFEPDEPPSEQPATIEEDGTASGSNGGR